MTEVSHLEDRMTQDPSRYPSRKPTPAADIAEKLATLKTTPLGEHELAMVSWWQTNNDPALASLGGGVVTVSVVQAPVVTDTHLIIPHPLASLPNTGAVPQAIEHAKHPAQFLHEVALDDVLDLHIVTQGEFSTRDMQEMVGAAVKAGQ
jgi:hypothetical protein